MTLSPNASDSSVLKIQIPRVRTDMSTDLMLCSCPQTECLMGCRSLHGMCNYSTLHTRGVLLPTKGPMVTPPYSLFIPLSSYVPYLDKGFDSIFVFKGTPFSVVIHFN